MKGMMAHLTTILPSGGPSNCSPGPGGFPSPVPQSVSVLGKEEDDFNPNVHYPSSELLTYPPPRLPGPNQQTQTQASLGLRHHKSANNLHSPFVGGAHRESATMSGNLSLSVPVTPTNGSMQTWSVPDPSRPRSSPLTAH